MILFKTDTPLSGAATGTAFVVEHAGLQPIYQFTISGTAVVTLEGRNGSEDGWSLIASTSGSGADVCLAFRQFRVRVESSTTATIVVSLSSPRGWATS